MLVTKLFRTTPVRILNKLNVTMSQKSLLSFFQKKSSDDPTRSPLQENTVSEKSQKSPLKVLKSPSKAAKSPAKAISPSKAAKSPSKASIFTSTAPKSPSKVADVEKHNENEKLVTEPSEKLKDKKLKGTAAKKRSSKKESPSGTSEKVNDESSKDTVRQKSSKKEKSPSEAPKKIKSSKKRKQSEEREVVRKVDEKDTDETVSREAEPEEKSPSEAPKKIKSSAKRKRSEERVVQKVDEKDTDETVSPEVEPEEKSPSEAPKKIKSSAKRKRSEERVQKVDEKDTDETVSPEVEPEEKSPSEAPKKIKSSAKRKRSEERVAQKVDEKDTDAVSPEAEPEKMDTTEIENATENVDVNKPEPSTPVLRTLSYLSSKKSTRKTKSKTPAKKKSNASPKETNAAKKIKVDKDNHSSDTDQPKDSQVDVNTNKKETENNKSTGTNDKPKVAAFLNTKQEDSSESISYNPSKERYNPIEDACWKQGQRVPYLALAKTLQKIEETSARLKIISILSNYFRSVIALNKEDLLPSLYLCLNQLGPAYEAQELGIADTYLMKAIAQCTGRSVAQIKSNAAEIGDLGIVAEQSRSTQRIMFRPSPLTVRSVFNQLTEIAHTSGQAAVNKKIDKIQGLFVSCRDCEARYVIRSLAGKLRIGLAEQSVIQALALACTTTPPSEDFPPKVLDASKKISAEEFKKRADEELFILKSTYSECPNYNLIVPVLLEKGLRALPEYCKITPGIPVKPMLAQPTKGIQEVLQRFEGLKFTCEWKYDGERAQIHVLEDGSIKLYSRNMEDNTSKYPDIIADIRQFIKPEVKSCILDAEAVAWDQEQQKIMPFQILSTRKRKGADINEIKVHVCVFLFDLLYLNGESFIQKPLIERRNALKANFNMLENKFAFVKSLDTNTMEEVEEFLEVSVKSNCEGLMIKTLDIEATYEIAKRSRNWLKLKKDYLDGCGDTLDLVVIGGYTGKGKRTGQYGGFLLASYDADNEEYQTICKIGTGFTEEALAKHTETLKELVIPKAKSYYRFDSAHEPDFWFDAVQVWEVKCADLSLSPVYYSGIGLVDPEKGISLRFPRFLRVREDKSAEQATSSSQVADLYRNQDQIKNQANSAEKFNEEDF